ncbi:MAG: hypothetical protein BWY76_03261 [bacterium ADurb.Bin429]|nr:MAG: hypothetical protein BWY76_03261 [bacterium ADurb.Bin429]
MKDGATAYAALFADGKKDYFIGCPVQAGNPNLRIRLCNTLGKQWVVSLHNPTNVPIITDVWTAKNWPLFTLKKTAYTVPAGSSVEIEVKAK